jgi:hypothetical protein
MDDHQLRQQRELLERIDACRTGSDDLRDELLAPLIDALAADPRKRALLESVQQFDAAIIDVMEDVPLPPGLQERLLESLATAEAARALEAQSTIDYIVDEQSTSPSLASPADWPGPKTSRRKMLWSALAATAAGIGGVSLVASRYWLAPDLTQARVLDETIAFYGQDVPEDLQTTPPPPSLPFSKAVSRNVRYMGWRRVNNFLGRANLNGVAFELSQNGTEATLYVVPATIASLKSWPLSRPDATTAGRSMSVWQGRGVMYVLVVDGGPGAYRGFIRQSGVV